MKETKAKILGWTSQEGGFCHEKNISSIKVLIVCLSVFLIGCGATFSRQIKSYGHFGTGVVFPRHLGQLTLVDVQEFEVTTPGAGVGLSYEIEDSTRASIYLYTAMNPSISSDIQDPWIHQEFKNTIKGIQGFATRGIYKSFQIMSEDIVFFGPEKKPQRGHLARLRYEEEGVLQESWLYLSSFEGNLLKVRYTYPAKQAAIAKEQCKKFLQALGVIFAGTREAQPADKELSVVVCFDYKRMAPRARGTAWLGYNVGRVAYIKEHRSDYRVVQGHIPTRFDEEVFARSKLTGMWTDLKESEPNLEDRYLSELLSVNKSGFMKEYVWHFLRRGWWKTPSDHLRLKEFKTWAEKHLVNHQPETHSCVLFFKIED